MRLYQQLILFMLAATVLPLVVVGFWLLRTSEHELAAQIGNEQRALAQLAAERSTEQLVSVIDSVGRAADLIDWLSVTPEELRGGLSLLFQQSESISAVAFVDPSGKQLVQPVYLDQAQGRRSASSEAGLELLKAAIPLQALKRGARGEAVLSEPYKRADGSAGMALSIKVSAGEDSPFVLVELALSGLSSDLQSRVQGGRHVIHLVNREGVVIASSDPERVLKPLSELVWNGVKAGTGGTVTVGTGDERALVSSAKAGERLGLLAVVQVREAEAMAPVAAMRRTVLLSIGGALLVLLALGALFTRRLNARLGTVVKGVEAMGRGELSTRVPVNGADELTDLAETFNRMGGELEAARSKLLTWNDELKQKVDEATAELREAQAQLVEAQKLAAVGQLGAGVAHEINNPLAGILGNTQLLMLDRGDKDPDFETLKKIEQSAKRCKEITQNLLRFSQQQKDKSEPRPMDLNGVIRDALNMSQTQAQGEGVTLESALSPEPVRVNGDPGQLCQVVLAMISNARTAMLKAPTRKLTLRTRNEGDSAVLEVSDTGKGIKDEHLSRIFEPFFTTKDVWTNVGLGLSVAYRVVTEHKGKIEVQTEVGKGTVFTVRLPKLKTEDKSAPLKAAG